MPAVPEDYRLRDAEALGAELWRSFLGQLRAASALVRDRNLSAVDAVHEARRALKRARASLRLLRPYSPDFAKSVDEEARVLGRLLSPYRDQDVVLEAIDQLLADANSQDPDDPALACLRRLRALEAHRRDSRAGRFRDDALEFVSRIGAIESGFAPPPGLSPTTGEILRSIGFSVAVIQATFADALAKGQQEAFHKCRKLTQRTLNQSYLIGDLEPEWSAVNLETLQALGGRLGKLQDLYLLEGRVADTKENRLGDGAQALLAEVRSEQSRCVDEAAGLQANLRQPAADRRQGSEPA